MFSQTGPPHDGYIVWSRYGNIGGSYLFQVHNDKLPSSGAESSVDSLATANLRSYPLSCTAASWDNSVEYLSQGYNSALCAVCGHRTGNLMISIRRSNKLNLYNVSQSNWFRSSSLLPCCRAECCIYYTRHLLPATNNDALPAPQHSNIIYQCSCHCEGCLFQMMLKN